MTSNFEFLKNKDSKLFNIMNEAEKLYRDGYFEQAAVQARKFAEIICKKTLGVRRTNEETFDEMLATLKDILGENPTDREFIDDLYFIKAKGNQAAHDDGKLSGSEALECLKRGFELSINYAIKNNWANKKIINSHFDIDILMTGKKYKFKEKYQEIRQDTPDIAEEILKRAQNETDENIQDEKENSDETLNSASDIKDEKVIKADFKKKKRETPSKNKKPAQKENHKKKKKEKPEKENKKEPRIDNDRLFYMIVFGVLFVMFISIMIFILPL